MKKAAILTALLILCSSLAAAQGLQAFGGGISERASTRILIWDGAAQKAAGELAINFGRPEWKEQYDEQLDQMTSGKFWRCGKDFWTVLDTNLPLKIGGVDVPTGYYYLAVRRSQDGSKWSLAFLSPEKARQMRLDAFEVSTRMSPDTQLFTAPLQFEKGDYLNKKFSIFLTNDPKDVKKASLKIAWGNFALTAPIEIEIG